MYFEAMSAYILEHVRAKNFHFLPSPSLDSFEKGQDRDSPHSELQDTDSVTILPHQSADC